MPQGLTLLINLLQITSSNAAVYTNGADQQQESQPGGTNNNTQQAAREQVCSQPVRRLHFHFKHLITIIKLAEMATIEVVCPFSQAFVQH